MASLAKLAQEVSPVCKQPGSGPDTSGRYLEVTSLENLKYSTSRSHGALRVVALCVTRTRCAVDHANRAFKNLVLFFMHRK